ncbi:MAG: hypothetical protein EBY49_09435 [Actinobacteria bacterium]|nr:hypothetical protein [Actinomycetota bacterium]
MTTPPPRTTRPTMRPMSPSSSPPRGAGSPRTPSMSVPRCSTSACWWSSASAQRAGVIRPASGTP